MRRVPLQLSAMTTPHPCSIKMLWVRWRPPPPPPPSIARNRRGEPACLRHRTGGTEHGARPTAALRMLTVREQAHAHANGPRGIRGRPFVASAVFSISILSLDAAKVRPITDTDVQSDGRPFALPRDSHDALPLRDAVAAAGPPC
eukprot:scaffold3945_cov105-Isochrysis_galbana.AAC.2